MKFKRISKLDDEEFRRLTGVKRGTFKKMIEILIEAEVKKKARGGKPNKQCMGRIVYLWHLNICENIGHISTLVEVMV